ncbi:unnamed protein product (macronuclear) [Paramecium tetraurelia]|uniref:Uncharacterized protein n=1 Tax=Paramecium tetraurelia TaxID=5888 RepID=A0CCR7_PARTE|nr:uncharacterized protein GSPATT00037369001 [Paramecium tetraurelia]CAK68584.1 unnamed protein product [Paramecium tetraurelia]|eukprot:XP_001435981.1 hypothetical protein (macronuclear) [Paramecium tetraurelia strain d4-2]
MIQNDQNFKPTVPQGSVILSYKYLWIVIKYQRTVQKYMKPLVSNFVSCSHILNLLIYAQYLFIMNINSTLFPKQYCSIIL